MRPPNLQFNDVSKYCEQNNVPLVAWPEDCGRYSWEEFPEINLYDAVEKYDLIHVEVVTGETNPVSTRPGRAYATAFINDVLFLVTFEPRDSASQEKCAGVEDAADAYNEGYSDGSDDGKAKYHTREVDIKNAYAEGYLEAGADFGNLVDVAYEAVEEAYDDGYGTGEQQGFARTNYEWLRGWDAGRSEMMKVEPEPLPESSQPDEEPAPPLVLSSEVTQYVPDSVPLTWDAALDENPPIPDEELHQVESEIEQWGRALPDFSVQSTPFKGDTTKPEEEGLLPDEDLTLDQWVRSLIDDETIPNTQPDPEEETEMSEVCTPCERLNWAIKAQEATEIREVTKAVLAPIASILGGDSEQVVDDMDDLFSETVDVLTALSTVEDADERDALEARFAVLEIDARNMQRDLEAKLAALNA